MIRLIKLVGIMFISFTFMGIYFGFRLILNDNHSQCLCQGCSILDYLNMDDFVKGYLVGTKPDYSHHVRMFGFQNLTIAATMFAFKASMDTRDRRRHK